MAETKRIILVCNHGPQHPEQATLPFVLALMAQAAAMETVLSFQHDGGMLLRQGAAEGVAARGFRPLKQILEAYLEDGGRLLVGAGCLEENRIAREELIAGVEVVSGAALARELRQTANEGLQTTSA